MKFRNSQGPMVLVASSLIATVLGSVHAFSIFLDPMEAAFGVSRATASLTYSICLVCLTVMVLFGSSIYVRFKPVTIFVGVSLLGAGGTVLAGIADDITTIWVGYGVMFGMANGLGYGFGLQLAARTNSHAPGLAMGVVTAAYASGAAISPYCFELLLAYNGMRAAMFALGTVILIIGLTAALIISKSNALYVSGQEKQSTAKLPALPIVLIWISYGSAVFAGLMAIGHAAGLAANAGLIGWLAPVGIATFNLIGSLISGWLADRASSRKLLIILPLISALALLGISLFPNFTIVFLCFVGFAYGGTIAVYPAAIAKQFPGDDGSRAYGRIFTAWGTAGLLSPWLAGIIFDQTGGYSAALWTATALAIISALFASKSIKITRNI